jgi:hypothetical protein
MVSTTEGVDDPNRGRAGTHGLSRIVDPWAEAMIFWSAIPIPCGTGCAEVNGAPAGHSRVQEMSPNSAGVRGASHAHAGHAGQTACLTSRVQLSDECGDLARHLAGQF